MKYKLIPSMAHNWTHSFMSGLNYIDHQFVFDDMFALARERHGEIVSISWIPERHEELTRLTPRVCKCVERYRAELPQYLAKHKIDAKALLELQTRVFVGFDFRMYVQAYVKDDRGKEYKIFV